MWPPRFGAGPRAWRTPARSGSDLGSGAAGQGAVRLGLDRGAPALDLVRAELAPRHDVAGPEGWRQSNALCDRPRSNCTIAPLIGQELLSLMELERLYPDENCLWRSCLIGCRSRPGSTAGPKARAVDRAVAHAGRAQAVVAARGHALSGRRQRRALAAADPIRLHRAAPAPALPQLDYQARAQADLAALARRAAPAATARTTRSRTIHRIRSRRPWPASSLQQTV